MNGDEWVACPACSRDCEVIDLCECDDDSGPLCGRCCETDHPVGLKLWEVA